MYGLAPQATISERSGHTPKVLTLFRTLSKDMSNLGKVLIEGDLAEQTALQREMALEKEIVLAEARYQTAWNQGTNYALVYNFSHPVASVV